MKREQYSLMHKRFVSNLCDPKSKTYGKITKSYIAAGYSDGPSVHQCASRLLSTDKIKRLVEAFAPDSGEKCLKKQEISNNYTLVQLQETYDRAVIKQDTPSQIACVRLMMQYNNMLTERIVVTQADAMELDQAFSRQCKQIASIITMNGGQLPEQLTDVVDQQSAPEPVDAVFEDATADVV